MNVVDNDDNMYDDGYDDVSVMLMIYNVDDDR